MGLGSTVPVLLTHTSVYLDQAGIEDWIGLAWAISAGFTLTIPGHNGSICKKILAWPIDVTDSVTLSTLVCNVVGICSLTSQLSFPSTLFPPFFRRDKFLCTISPGLAIQGLLNYQSPVVRGPPKTWSGARFSNVFLWDCQFECSPWSACESSRTDKSRRPIVTWTTIAHLHYNFSFLSEDDFFELHIYASWLLAEVLPWHPMST